MWHYNGGYICAKLLIFNNLKRFKGYTGVTVAAKEQTGGGTLKFFYLIFRCRWM